jgi:hypothetical protein
MPSGSIACTRASRFVLLEIFVSSALGVDVVDVDPVVAAAVLVEVEPGFVSAPVDVWFALPVCVGFDGGFMLGAALEPFAFAVVPRSAPPPPLLLPA